jgi:cephalosporin hydroxylase
MLSFFALSKVTRGPNFKMIGIDIEGSVANSYKKYSDPSMQFFCMDDMYFIRSLNKYKFIPRRDYDIVFIDTSHLYAHTQFEIRTFAPLLSKDGMLIFHDSNMSP